MKILLLNPPIIMSNKIFMKELGRCGSTASGNQFWPQTGLAYLASSAGKNEVRIIDGIAEKLTIADLLESAVSYSPRLVILSTTTPTFKNDGVVLSLLKKKLPTAEFGFVGTHTSWTPYESLKNSQADFIILNEPELTFSELLYEKNKSKIRGIGYKKGAKIIINPHRGLSGNLDELPFPARNLLPNEKYRMVLTNNEPFATVVPSRGCPHQCIYCRVGYPWGKKFRQRTVANVISEIEEILDWHKIRNIVFMADTFTLDKDWILEFCSTIAEKDLDFTWLCNSRVDTLDEEMIIAMKQAGCTTISFGVESASQKILDRAKKNLDITKAKAVFFLVKKHGIKSFAYFVIGLPGETKDTVKETISFSKELDPDYVNFHIATPHPGTELHKMAVKNNWIQDYDYDHYDQSGNYSVMSNEELSAADILKAQKRAMREFYFRPKIFARQLSRIKTKDHLLSVAKIGLSILKK